MKLRVIKEYNDAPEKPIQIFKGEEFSITEESDPNGDWPNWLFCKRCNKEGWVPKQIISINGKLGVSKEDYSAKEFNLNVGEIIVSNRELNGWIWGYKESNSSELGWAPLNYLEQL